MKFLRNRFISRTISVFLLLVFVQSIFLPDYAFALTSGPHQPEYTSYEDAGATDMVNLLTGDFNFNIPIMEVPGPEGNFAVPLSYHAGIGPEQEASWVGLGWNINAGSITRDINQFPDDATKDPQVVTVQDLTGVQGWNRIFNYPFRDSWDSQAGYYGNVNLLDIVDVGFGNRTDVGIGGVHVGDHGVRVDPVQVASAAMNIISLGTSSGATTAVAIAKQAAISVVIGSTLAFAMPIGTPQGGTGGNWDYTVNNGSPSYKFYTSLSFLSGVPVVSRKKSYHIILDQSRTEDMFGVLYLGNPHTEDVSSIPDPGISSSLQSVNGEARPLIWMSRPGNTTNRGSASDINFTSYGSSYQQAQMPTTLATDNYIVNAPGVGGGITPYRLDVGSVSVPREMTNNHVRYSSISYLTDYKVPFVYMRANAGNYLHPLGAALGDSPGPGFYYGLDFQRPPECPFQPCGEPSPAYYYLTDAIFDAQNRVKQSVEESKKIPQQTYVEWLSNQEITNSATYASKFLDFLPASQRASFRTAGNVVPTAAGIGGYTITAADGTTYHFALPVYDYNQLSEVINTSDDQKKSRIERNTPFANSWLLTAITGSDFIDRDGDGQAGEGDWGHWIKMNYGKYADDFKWRSPYNGTIINPGGQYGSYEQGRKQLYYLNSIETRSHVALFMKSQREDGRSAPEIDNGTPGLIVPLKLDEICLVKKEIYKKLTSSSYNIPTFTNSISNLCLTSQFVLNVRDFVNKNCEKRVVFNYGYDLCKGTPNAGGPNNAQKGKLTLKRISIKGRSDLAVAPDYKFEYGNNHSYDPSNWDGWGMYGGTASHETHDPDDTNGSAWSLSKITTPVGGEIAVSYERDTYGSISGESMEEEYYPTIPLAGTVSTQVASQTTTLGLNTTTHGILPGETVELTGIIGYSCVGGAHVPGISYGGQYTVASVSGSTITLSSPYLSFPGCSSTNQVTIVENWLTMKRIIRNRKGGNIRVSSITIKNELGVGNKLRYLYSSGAVSVEPEYIRKRTYPFYNYLKYPRTPVIYGQVSVLSGKLENDSDYYSKQVFEFETPNKSMLLYSAIDQGSDPITKKYLYTFEDRTARIGRLNSIKIYDKAGNITSRSQLQYSHELPNNTGVSFQGYFSESTILSELVGGTVKHNRTSVITYPDVLKKVVNSKDGFSSETQNLVWDYNTGSVLEILNKSSLGVYVKTILKPAYLTYPELGPKALDANNRNMVSQIAGKYTYKSDAAGTSLGLISAEVQTWSKDWNNYRYYNGSSYVVTPEETESALNRVWRKGPAYVWKGSNATLRVEKDGTHNFSPSDDFNFAPQASNPLWQYTGEILRFDHFGMPLESKDMNNIRSAVKMGYNDRTMIASATNAAYHEIAFSSAEDLYADKPFFGGEVGLGNGTVKYLSKGQAASTHTGDAVVAVSSGYAFKYNTSGLKAQRKYKASVWTNSTNGKLYYKLNGGSEIIPAQQTISSPVNGWYRLDVVLPLQAADYNLEIGVKSANNTEVHFDDFRFQPVESAMTCYVYPSNDFEFTATSSTYLLFVYSLDNDNTFTKLEYNEKGQLARTYRESIRYGVKLVSESKNNFRRSNVNQ